VLCCFAGVVGRPSSAPPGREIRRSRDDRTVYLGYFRPAGSVAPRRSEMLGSGRVGSGGEGAVWAEGFLFCLSSPTSYVSQRDNDAANLNKKPNKAP
jgi:hypothetical protein